MKDITVIYLTANKHTDGFAKYQRKVLLNAIGDIPIISVSRKPIDFGKNIIDTEKYCTANIYYQMLVAARMVKTDYIAIAEDDVFYSNDHFTFYRPPMDTFAYDMSRWILFPWSPLFSIKQRKSNSTLIAPTDILVEVLEERFNKYTLESYPVNLWGEIGRNKLERQMGLTERKSIEVYCPQSSVHINHFKGTDAAVLIKKKRHGSIKAIEIPQWGRAKDVANLLKSFDI